MKGQIICVLFVFGISFASADCDNVPVIANAENDSIRPGPYASGTIVNFECSPGFNPAGTSKSYRCSGDKWVDGNLRCEEIFCGYVETPENGKVVNTPTNQVGTSINFECNEGFKRVGADFLLCRTDGNWSPSQPPICEIKMCGEFGSIQYASTFQDTSNNVRNGYGSIVEVTCDQNYVLNGQPTVKCQADGTWGERPKCEKSICPHYPGLNSSCIKHTLLSNNFLFIVCVDDVPVKRTGPDASECKQGKWDNTDMACYCYCKVEADSKLVTLENVNNGFLEHGKDLQWSCKSDSTKVPITCNDGNELKPMCEANKPPVTVTYKPVTDENGSTVNPPPRTDKPSEQSSPVGGIIGGIIGGLAVIACIVVAVICYKKKTGNRNPGGEGEGERKAMFTNGNGSEQNAEKEKVKLTNNIKGEAV